MSRTIVYTYTTNNSRGRRRGREVGQNSNSDPFLQIELSQAESNPDIPAADPLQLTLPQDNDTSYASTTTTPQQHSHIRQRPVLEDIEDSVIYVPSSQDVSRSDIFAPSPGLGNAFSPIIPQGFNGYDYRNRAIGRVNYDDAADVPRTPVTISIGRFTGGAVGYFNHNQIAAESPAISTQSSVGVVPVPSKSFKKFLMPPKGDKSRKSSSVNGPIPSTSSTNRNLNVSSSPSQERIRRDSDKQICLRTRREAEMQEDKCCCKDILTTVNRMQQSIDSITQMVEKLADTVSALQEGIHSMPVPPTPPGSPCRNEMDID